MPKNLFQDMVRVKKTKRQMDDFEAPTPRTTTPPVRPAPAKIPIPTPIRIQTPPVSTQKNMDYVSEDEVRRMYSPSRQNKSNSKHGLWLVAGITILFFLFALSFFFAMAEVVIDPKIKDVSLSQSFSAIKDVNPDGLAFDLVIISGEETKKVPGGEEKQLALNAVGTIFIYNSFSTDPQKLAAGTKLEGSNNKLYKTTLAITIPGMDEDGIPGKSEVSITAVEPGEGYNSDPLDFKIAGFKGTSKYEKIYGRSVGNISGGFLGASSTITDADKEVAFSELESILKDKLLAKATDQIPGGFILYKDAAFLKVDEENVGFTAGDTNVPVHVKGTLYGFLLNEKTLTDKIAKAGMSDYDDAPVYIPNIRDLTFSLTDTDISYADIQGINFKMTGTPNIVWKFDSDEFRKELLGKKKTEFNQLLTAHTNVESAELTLSPFWVRSFPNKLKNIKIIVNYPN